MARTQQLLKLTTSWYPSCPARERGIPLNRLHLSPNNVRKKHDPSTIPELAAAIMAKAFSIRGDPEKIKGQQRATTGGCRWRRLAALHYLAEHAAVPADVPVRCRVFDAERGVSVSGRERHSGPMPSSRPAGNIQTAGG